MKHSLDVAMKTIHVEKIKEAVSWIQIVLEPWNVDIKTVMKHFNLVGLTVAMSPTFVLITVQIQPMELVIQ